MKTLNEELGSGLDNSILINHPGWSNGNNFLFYTESENACSYSDKKDGFVTVCINGKTGGVNICIKIDSVDETPFTFPRQINGRDIQIPCIEKVEGVIVAVNYCSEEQEYDFFVDGYELIGKYCTAYWVDFEAIEEKENLAILYQDAKIPGDEDSEMEAAFDRYEQFEKNCDRIWEIGYYGDFIIL